MCVVFILTKTIFYLEIMELRMGERVVPKRQEERIQEKKTKLPSAREEIKNGRDYLLVESQRPHEK